jgi:hypothetical protein
VSISIAAPNWPPTVNMTQGRQPTRELYTRKEFHLVANAFAADVRLFGYSDAISSGVQEGRRDNRASECWR